MAGQCYIHFLLHSLPSNCLLLSIPQDGFWELLYTMSELEWCTIRHYHYKQRIIVYLLMVPILQTKSLPLTSISGLVKFPSLYHKLLFITTRLNHCNIKNRFGLKIYILSYSPETKNPSTQSYGFFFYWMHMITLAKAEAEILFLVVLDWATMEGHFLFISGNRGYS